MTACDGGKNRQEPHNHVLDSYDHVELPAISLFSDNKPKTTELLLNRIARGTPVVVRILGFSNTLVLLSDYHICSTNWVRYTSNYLQVLA